MSDAVSLRNYQFDSYPLNVTFPNSLYQSLAQNTSKLLVSYVQDRIRKEMPSLYPLYERAIKPEVSFDHYHRLREAERCIQARLDCLPLPLSCRYWSVIYPEPNIDVTAIQDDHGHRIFHWNGEPRESLTLRLAFRHDPKAYMPISVDPLRLLFGNEDLPFRDGMITGCEVGGRPIYLFGEAHESASADSIKQRLLELVLQGKIAWFAEGSPFHSEAIRELKKLRQIPNDGLLFGLEHLGYYALAFCIRQITDSSFKLLIHVYWLLNWTQKGREIWQLLADSYNRTQSELLKTAFVGLPLDRPINKSLEDSLSVNFGGKQLWPRLAKLILDNYPGMHLQKNEKETISSYLNINNIFDVTKFDKCTNLLADLRDAIFADAILAQQKNLPPNLPVVVTVGIHHLHGLLRQIQAQLTGQGRTKDNWYRYKHIGNFEDRLNFAERLRHGCNK